MLQAHQGGRVTVEVGAATDATSVSATDDGSCALVNLWRKREIGALAGVGPHADHLRISGQHSHEAGLQAMTHSLRRASVTLGGVVGEDDLGERW